MNIIVKTKKEIEIMKKGGEILSKIIGDLLNMVKRGVSTQQIDDRALELCRNYNVKPAFKGYQDYPAVTCLGVNDTVVHGIPDRNELLNDGDIISIDMGIMFRDFFLDCARTKGVGVINPNAMKLISITEKCLISAIDSSRAGNTIGDIGHAIQSTAEANGFSVVKQMVGHGIGRNLHEEPQVPGFGYKGEGLELKDGMTIAIESIINEGSEEIVFLEDGWTTKTLDGRLSALFEDTIAIGKNGSIVLTR